MKLAAMCKLIIEADPVTMEEIKQRLREWGALDSVAVRRSERILPLVEVNWHEQGDMLIEAVADSRRIDFILAELGGFLGDNSQLNVNVIVSDMFGYPLFRWHSTVGKRHVPREVYWATQFLTI
jgi:hypothetical protein